MNVRWVGVVDVMGGVRRVSQEARVRRRARGQAALLDLI
jgi:hypothetical protein